MKLNFLRFKRIIKLTLLYKTKLQWVGFTVFHRHLHINGA